MAQMSQMTHLGFSVCHIWSGELLMKADNDDDLCESYKLP